MGNIQNKTFVFDDKNVDNLLENDVEEIIPSVKECYNKSDTIKFYEAKIELLNDQIQRLENNYDDLYLDYSRIKIKYDALVKKLD